MVLTCCFCKNTKNIFATKNNCCKFAPDNLIVSLFIQNRMRKLSFILIGLICAFCVSCSNDPKIEQEFVKAVDEAVAKLENATTMEEVQAFAEEVQKISENEQFCNLRESGAAKEAAAKLEKATENMEAKMQEVAAAMLENAVGGDAEQPKEEEKQEE